MLDQLLVSGIAQGAIYALVALSMTVVYRATTIVNFAHGDMVMGGAFVVYVAVVVWGGPYIAGAALGILVMFGLGFAVHRGLIRPMGAAPHLVLAMMTVAVAYVLRGLARTLWGREVLPMPQVFPDRVFFVGDVIITMEDIVIVGSVAVLMTAFFIVFHASTLGKMIQAVYQSERGAALVGINVAAFHGVMWGVGAAMGAIGGILVAPVTLLYPDMGASLLIHGFAAMTLGGFGSLWGAVIGGLLLGVGEMLAGTYISTALIDIAAYLVIIAVLVVRPAGILGRRQVVRV